MAALRQQIEAALKRPLGAGLALLVLMCALVLPGQWSIPPIDRDEPRFAQATRQMVESGDFVDIRYQDLPRHLQPAGIYWLQSASVALFGDEDRRAIWPHRVPSWLSAIAIAFLTWRLGAMFFGAAAGRWAGVLMGAALLLSVEARIAKIDATLAFATLLTQLAFARHYLAARGAAEVRVPIGWTVLFWAALGWGVLLKGPIILLVTGGCALALWALDRQARWAGLLRPLWGVPLFLAIALPWYVAIGIVTDGEFYRTALGYSVLGKVADTHQSHGGPFGFHAGLFTGLFWPGSLFALLALPLVWKGWRTPQIRFLFAWVVPAWVVFEISGTKLPHYTLPLFPAFAALAGLALDRNAAEKRLGAPWWLAVPAGLLWLVFGLLPVAGVAAVVRSETGEIPTIAYIVAGAGLVAMFVTLSLAIAGRARAAAALAVAIAAIAYPTAFGALVPRLDTLFVSPRIVAAAREAAPCPGGRIISSPYAEPSLVFLAGADTLLAKDGAQAAQALLEGGPCDLALIGEESAGAFAEAAAGAATPVAVVTGRNHNEGGDAVALTLYRRR